MAPRRRSHAALPGEALAPDLIIDQATIYTVDRENSTAEAVAIRDGRIAAVGASSDVRRLAGPRTHVVDLCGLTVVPGFVDGHPHMDGVGMRLLRPSFPDTSSLSAIQGRVKEEAARRAPGEWLVFNPIADAPDAFALPGRILEARWPTRVDLDAAAPGHPVLIRAPMMVAPGVAIANSSALERAGIGRNTRPPDGVEIDVDTHGEPTGLIWEFNFPPVIERALFPMLPRPDHADWVRAVRAGARAFNEVGVTAIYEGHGLPAEPQAAYLDLWAQRALTVRTYFVISYPVAYYRDSRAGDALIRETARYAAGPGFGDDLLKLGGLGFSFDSATAIGASRMREPYVGPRGYSWTGVQHVTDEDFETIVRKAARAGLRVQVQCAGGRAIDSVLAIYERIDRETPLAGRRWVIEHCQFPSRYNMDACRRLGVIPTTTTNFLWCYGSIYLRSFGRALAEDAIPLRAWLDAGLDVVQSTDGHPYSPIFTFWQSLARRDGFTGERLTTPHQALTREQALRAYTIHGARITFWEDDIGSIEVGKLADLAILSQDIMHVPEDRIPDTKVLATLLAGRAVHDTGLFASQEPYWTTRS